MFTVIGTDTYSNEVRKWSKSDREIAEKLPRRLSFTPLIGDPLGYPFLRERRVRQKRIYYLVYEDLELVLLVATSGKKDQQETIDHIKDYLDEFRKIAEKVIRQVS